jgi:hypothetical protein
MSNGTDSAEDPPEPAQKLLYHATGKLYRYLARFAGEDPDEVEQAYHDSFETVTAGADPVQISEAVEEGIELGFSLAERRRALRRYDDELVRQQLAPPAYDTERLEAENGEAAGLRVLVSESDCRFFTDRTAEELLVRTPDGGEVEVPLAFEPGPIETVDAGETVTEVIARPAGWTPESEADDAEVCEEPESPEAEREDGADPAGEYLDAAREVVLEDPGRALLAAERGGPDTGRLVASLLERKPAVPIEGAPDIVDEAIQRVGLDALEERYDELVAAQAVAEDDASEETEIDDATEDGGDSADEPPSETEGGNG